MPVLSSQGLARGASLGESDFVFLGNSSQLHCTQFQAGFISPRVYFLLQVDKTVNSFSVDISGSAKEEERLFRVLAQFMNGTRPDERPCRTKGFRDFAAFLGNTELIDLFHRKPWEIDESNVCSRLKRKSVDGRSVDDEIEFAAAHFDALDLKELRELETSILGRILSSPGLRLKTEDSLLDFICRLERDDEIVLLRELQIDYLSSEAIPILLRRLPESGLDRSLWDSVCRRLCLPLEGQIGRAHV
jgi:hypothetical protein